MSARTKMLRTRRRIEKSKSSSVSVPWREALKEHLDKHTEAGVLLRAYRAKAELTQKELADILEVSQHHISEMENGKRPIGKTMAKKLADFFKTDYRRFL